MPTFRSIAAIVAAVLAFAPAGEAALLPDVAAACEDAAKRPGVETSAACQVACQDIRFKSGPTQLTCMVVLAAPAGKPAPSNDDVGDLIRRGSASQSCIEDASKIETIEQTVARFSSEDLRKTQLAFWNGRPQCVGSAYALVKKSRCMVNGARDIREGVQPISDRVSARRDGAREEFCRAAEPLVIGPLYDAIGQVGTHTRQIEQDFKELTLCAKEFRKWTAEQHDLYRTMPNRIEAVGSLITDLQGMLEEFSGVQNEFESIVADLEKAKSGIDAAAIRVATQCPKTSSP